ncbi:hypothetical protein ASF57_17235 [Methylobacterium sp. Leaf117]|nr:hypothetical protein ASF57_17235 [Methylobacterium sp. Leaf117]
MKGAISPFLLLTLRVRFSEILRDIFGHHTDSLDGGAQLIWRDAEFFGPISNLPILVYVDAALVG